MFNSPLRYPGGKRKLAPFIAKVCKDNGITGHYIEPYTGGASVALFLLLENYVQKITINDKDRSIYAFWNAVLNQTEELCDRINKTKVTVDEWHQQRKIQSHKNDADLLDLGFSTFFMNRTNRSGIINGGIMGGLNQNGKYLIDCRFNKEDLTARIKRIALRKNDIELYNLDAIHLINLIEGQQINSNTIFYFDPPYYHKASSLYLNHYKDEDHKKLSRKIRMIRNTRWIVSYDNVPQIQELYEDYNKKEYSLKHTAFEARKGKEILFFSNNLVQPDIENYNPSSFHLIKNNNHIFIKYLYSKRPKKGSQAPLVSKPLS